MDSLPCCYCMVSFLRSHLLPPRDAGFMASGSECPCASDTVAGPIESKDQSLDMLPATYEPRSRNTESEKSDSASDYTPNVPHGTDTRLHACLPPNSEGLVIVLMRASTAHGIQHTPS